MISNLKWKQLDKAITEHMEIGEVKTAYDILAHVPKFWTTRELCRALRMSPHVVEVRRSGYKRTAEFKRVE